jgi:glycine/sarcosine N-methyltransferase
LTGAFYDGLAGTYDLMFADWDASMARQAAQLSEFVPPGARVLDCACGIGTQAIGLAMRGYEVVGADLSPKAASRAVAEASARGVSLPVAVAGHAFVAVRRRLVRRGPGGRLIISTRDYDEIRRERPSSTPPSVVGKARYWAITRHEITELAELAGFDYAEWSLHAYCQPLMVATNG